MNSENKMGENSSEYGLAAVHKSLDYELSQMLGSVRNGTVK